MARQVKIEILGDTRNLRSAFREAERSTTGFSKSIARAGVFAATGLAGIAAGLGVAAVKSIQAAQESNKVSKQTAAAIKSTGGAAHVTEKQIGDLATAISNKTGIDDEQIQSSENMLLTFTNVRNEAGRNNDVFSQATGILQDMSVALGVDSSKAAIQLGKALNDPIKGVTALSRVGVTFTQQQRDQIKTLVDSGKRMEAQKIILRELGKEFGGSAAAAATPLDRLKVVVGNLQEKIGNKLLPTVNAFSNWAISKGVPAISKFIDQVSAFWKTHGPELRDSLADVLHQLKLLLDPTSQFDDKLHHVSISADDVAAKLNKMIIWISKVIIWLRHAGEALDFAAKFADFLGTALHLRLRLAFLETAQIAGTVSKWILNIGVAAGLTGNVIDRFSGGSGHAFDSFVRDARNMRDQTERQLGGIRSDIDRTKREIAGLHAPKLVFTAEDHVNPVVQRIMREMRSRGFSVTARLVRGGTAQHGTRVPGYGGGDRHPYLLEGGETVVPKELTSEIAPWAAMRGIPGFQRGGLVWPGRVNLEASRDALLSRFMGGAVGGSADVRSVAMRTLTLLGRPLAELGAWVRRIMFESGGNPSIVNRSDSNWFAGHPSVGLAQVIRGTFAAWAGPFRGVGPFLYGVSINPLANSYAGANYAIHRYGSLFAVDPQVRHAGYDHGGYLQPGWTMAYNGTGRPEPVGAGGITINNHFHGPVIGSDLRRAAADLLQATREDLRRRGKGATANLL